MANPNHNFMDPTITCGRQYAHRADIGKSRFDDVNLAESEFHNVNLRHARFDDINLAESSFDNVNFSNVQITRANTSGMTIDGILVADLLAAYKKANT